VTPDIGAVVSAGVAGNHVERDHSENVVAARFCVGGIRCAANESQLLKVERNELYGRLEIEKREDAGGFQNAGDAAGIVVGPGACRARGIEVRPENVDIVRAHGSGLYRDNVAVSAVAVAEVRVARRQPEAAKHVENVSARQVVLSTRVISVVALLGEKWVRGIAWISQIAAVGIVADRVDNILNGGGQTERHWENKRRDKS